MTRSIRLAGSAALAILAVLSMAVGASATDVTTPVPWMGKITLGLSQDCLTNDSDQANKVKVTFEVSNNAPVPVSGAIEGIAGSVPFTIAPVLVPAHGTVTASKDFTLKDGQFVTAAFFYGEDKLAVGNQLKVACAPMPTPMPTSPPTSSPSPTSTMPVSTVSTGSSSGTSSSSSVGLPNTGFGG